MKELSEIQTLGKFWSPCKGISNAELHRLLEEDLKISSNMHKSTHEVELKKIPRGGIRTFQGDPPPPPTPSRPGKLYGNFVAPLPPTSPQRISFRKEQ